MKSQSITRSEYGAFQTAYDFFNRELWDSALPDLLVTLQRKGNMRGYFHGERFHHRANSAKTDELALNPDNFAGRTDEEILSTLAHEMAHVWEFHSAPRTAGYHSKKWGQEMLRIGLHPSSTGEPGGKMTGYRVSHYIVSGGMYAQAYAKLKTKGFKLHWQSGPETKERKKKRESKTKYTCPDCKLNAWAKPEAHLVCGDCGTNLRASFS